MDEYQFDRRFFPQQGPGENFRLAGVDEAGRGPLAGPVVAAAVILDPSVFIDGLNDSKALSMELREAVFQQITESAIEFSVAVVEPGEIDQINIFQASLKAMRIALRDLAIPPDMVLVDGNHTSGCGLNEKAIVKGDSKSASIMAASILAKVTRDHIMVDLDRRYPHYGFRGNKGYGSAGHLEALAIYGPCPEHRRSFEPIRALLSPQTEFDLT